MNLHSSATLVDLDGNPRTLEIVVGSGHGWAYGDLNVISHDGRVLAQYSTVGQVNCSPLVVDGDRDGHPEIYFGPGHTPQGNPPYPFDALEVNLTPRGMVLEEMWTVHLDTGLVWAMPAAAYVDGDGVMEIFVVEMGIPNTSAGGKRAYCYDHQGNRLWQFDSAVSHGLVAPLVFDLDGDGALEICFGVYDATYNVYDANGMQFQLGSIGPYWDPAPWPEFRPNRKQGGDYRRGVSLQLLPDRTEAPRGGHLRCGIQVSNNAFESQTVVLSMHILPGLLSVAVPYRLTLEPGATRRIDLALPIPALAPPPGPYPLYGSLRRSGVPGLEDESLVWFWIE